MAHNLNVHEGKHSYIGRQAAWHELGTVTGKYQTWLDIQAHGGIDYEVFKDRLDYHGKPIDSWGIFRRDNGVFLANCSEDYGIIQHSRGFDMIDKLVASVDGAHYETAGVLGLGEKVWGLADLKLSIHVGDDVTTAFLAFMTAYDSTMAHTYMLCNTRIVCWNTFRMALSERSKAQFRIRHTKNGDARLTEAHNALDNIAADVKTVEEKLNFLAGRNVTRESAVDIFDRLFPNKTDSKGAIVETTRKQNIVADILRLYELNDNNAFPEQRGTAYNLFNAITNYTDHERTSHNGRRAESAMFGTGDQLKTRALGTILEVAANMPSRPAGTIVIDRPQVVTPDWYKTV